MSTTITNFKRKTRKLAFKRYDLVENGVKRVLKDYGLKRLPLVTFNEFINKVMFRPEEIKQLKNLGNFCDHFNDSLLLIKDFARENGEHFGDNCVSLKEVEDWVKAAKKGFIIGQNG